MQVFFLDVAGATRLCGEAGVAAWPAAGEKAVRLGFAHRRPFLLDDDGGYDQRLNSFFRACPTLGVRSAASQKAYAYDLLAFARFLAAAGKRVWEADQHDIDRYLDHRCGEWAPEPLSLRSWNRAVAALTTPWAPATTRHALAHATIHRQREADPLDELISPLQRSRAQWLASDEGHAQVPSADVVEVTALRRELATQLRPTCRQAVAATAAAHRTPSELAGEVEAATGRLNEARQRNPGQGRWRLLRNGNSTINLRDSRRQWSSAAASWSRSTAG